jgi:hypothetical protein
LFWNQLYRLSKDQSLCETIKDHLPECINDIFAQLQDPNLESLFSSDANSIDSFFQELEAISPKLEYRLKVISHMDLTEKTLFIAPKALWGKIAQNLLLNFADNDDSKESAKAISMLLSDAGFVGFEYPANFMSGGNENGASNYVIFNEDDLRIVEHTRFRVYKSKDGKETKYKQLSLFGEGNEAIDDRTRPNSLQREGDSTIERLNHLRELQEGEICNVERKFTESKEFSFTRGEKIESAADVAYIFKSLEDEAIENSFVAVTNGDNVTVLHLGMGAQTQTVVDTTAIFAAVLFVFARN